MIISIFYCLFRFCTAHNQAVASEMVAGEMVAQITSQHEEKNYPKDAIKLCTYVML